MKSPLTIEELIESAQLFCETESEVNHFELIGITDGKAVGTYVEHRFQHFLESNYIVEIGSSAKGIDLPGTEIQTDIKVTSITQPQSSCPFENARQKIFGLGYNLLVFVYKKQDKNVPGDEIVYNDLADEIFDCLPKQGYLTISNALQWRLQYGRVIALDNSVSGVVNYEW